MSNMLKRHHRVGLKNLHIELILENISKDVEEASRGITNDNIAVLQTPVIRE